MTFDDLVHQTRVRSISQAPVTASRAAASVPVTTRQIVAFDGGPATGRVAPHRRYRSSSTSAGTSAAHPAIRGERPVPGDHRGGGQRQHRRHRMMPPPARPPVRHPGEQFQQVTASARCRAQGGRPPIRHRTATGNDTIRHGEAPAGEGSVGRHLVLPGLRLTP